MAATRVGRQTPTAAVVLPYTRTKGLEAVDLYNQTGRNAMEWQQLQCCDIMAVREDGLWTHTKYGLSVSRRNGKNEVVTMRELWGITQGEKILHTAHRTTTSTAAAFRLATQLDDLGYTEIARPKKDRIYRKAYSFAKQIGLEKITILDEGGGSCSFRTRTSKGGLGEGFDLLVVDEAQEYMDDQESSLKYVVSDSSNPQVIMCGTPPTAVSSGTVFPRLRRDVLFGNAEDCGWAEWGVTEMTDPFDKEAWYEANPSMGVILTERKVKAEIGSDKVDFNIQRLGLWMESALKSIFTKVDWEECQLQKLPRLESKLFVGIKYCGDSVSMSVASKTSTGKIFVEALDCRPRRDGDDWILAFLAECRSVQAVAIDGASGQQNLTAAIKDARIRLQPVLPTVKDIIAGNAAFEQAVFGGNVRHCGQPSLAQAVTNCDKRPIGSNGGFGFKAQREDIDITLLDSCVLAFYICQLDKGKKRQRISA